MVVTLPHPICKLYLVLCKDCNPNARNPDKLAIVKSTLTALHITAGNPLKILVAFV